MSKKRGPGKHSKEIPVFDTGDELPTAFAHAVTKNLSKKIARYASQTGTKVDAIVADHDSKDFANGLTLHRGNGKCLVINPHIAIGCLLRGHIEGGLRHELSHLFYDMVKPYQKLLAVVDLVTDFRMLLERFPNEIEEKIAEHFGSVQSVKPFMEKLEALRSVVDEIDINFGMRPDLIYQRGALTVALEKNHSFTQRLIAQLNRLPSLKNLLRTGRVLSSLHRVSPEEKDLYYTNLREFCRNWSHAQEYLADAQATRWASDPKSFINFLKHNVRAEAKEVRKDLPKTRENCTAINRLLLEMDRDTHPPMQNRIRLMDYIDKHKTFPDEMTFARLMEAAEKGSRRR